jgi:hypothetical protein
MHDWPDMTHAIMAASGNAELKSASSSTMWADLPPSSSSAFFTVAAPAARIARPVAVDPVKVIMSTRGSADNADCLVVDLAPCGSQLGVVHAGVDQVGEVLAMLGPVLDFLDRALDLAPAHRDRAADLGDQDPPQPLLVAVQRIVQLGQAVVTEVEIARPVGLVERAPRRADGTFHVGDGGVGRLTDHLFAGRVDHVEHRTAARMLEVAVDQHPLVAGQHTRISLHTCHLTSRYQRAGAGVSMVSGRS